MSHHSKKAVIRHERDPLHRRGVCRAGKKPGTNSAFSASFFMIPLFALGIAAIPLLLSAPALTPYTLSAPMSVHSAAPQESLRQVPVLSQFALTTISPPYRGFEPMKVSWMPHRMPGASLSSATTSTPDRSSDGDMNERPHAAAPEPQAQPKLDPSLSSMERTRFERFYRRWLSMPEELRPLPVPETFHAAAPKPRADNVAGVFLTASSVARHSFLLETLDAVARHPHPAIVVDVKGSFVYFHSDAALAAEHGLIRPLYELPELYRLTQERGIYLIARYIAVKDHSLSNVLPETQVRNLKTNTRLGLGWVDPAHPLTLEYNRQIIEDVVPYVDEINLDYIRYSTALPSHYYGINGDEKADRIEEFIKMTRETIDAHSPSTIFGISTYAILGWNFPINLEPLGQHIPRFAPYVDIISPMAYPATFSVGSYYNPAKHPRSRMYYLVYRTLTGYNDLVGEEHQHKIRPWIQGYSVTTQNMRDQMDAVYDAGHCGYQVWSAGNHYAPTYAAMGSRTPPERCL